MSVDPPPARPTSPQGTTSSGRFNAIGAINGARRYLEIGVSRGVTFLNVEIPHRVGVDPAPLFDLALADVPGTTFHVLPSDTYFDSDPSDRFDVIFIDGLHTFAQTLRDFTNSLSVSHARTVWIIDDTVPLDFCSAMADFSRTAAVRRATNDPSVAWHGDVFKALFTIHDFFPAFDYRTVVGKGNPQTILVQSRRTDFKPRWNDLERLARLDFADFVLNRDIIKACSEEDALTWLRSVLTPPASA